MTYANPAMTRRNALKSFTVRRFAVLLQLACVGLLLVGRIAAGVVDGSVTPPIGSAIVAGSSGTDSPK